MLPIILDGRKTRDEMMVELIERIKKLQFRPILAIVQVGDRSDSTTYIKSKKSFADRIGVEIIHIRLPESVSQIDLIHNIEELNLDSAVNGIIVQLPLPISIDRDVVIDAIDPKKDVDGLTPTNVNGWSEGRRDVTLIATARGVRELFKRYGIGLFGKKVTVVGRSKLVGAPIAAMCSNEGAVVTVCHSKTTDLVKETRDADIIIVAAGKPNLITADHVRVGQVIIDVGINTVIGEKLDDEIMTKKLVGDVDFEAVKGIVSAITPVPGGVGPMTVVSLFENLIDLCEKY